MTRLSTDLPGSLSQRKVLVETLTYISDEPDTYGWIAPADVAARPVNESSYTGRGIQVIRSTEEGWAHEPGAVVTEVRVLLGVPVRPEQAVAAVLTNCPDDVVHFLEEYAPEVLATAAEWQDEQHPPLDLTHIERDQDR